MIGRLLLAAALLPAAFSSGIAAGQRIDGARSWPRAATPRGSAAPSPIS